MNAETRRRYVYFRLYFLIAMAVLSFYLVIHYFETPWVTGPVMFNIGVDLMGMFICISLCYACMYDDKFSLEESAYWMIGLVFQIALNIFNNELSWLTYGRSEYRTWSLIFNEISFIFDFGLVILFYNYVRRTLDFKGKLAKWMNKAVFYSVIPFILMILANSFAPINFFIDEQGFFQMTSLYRLTDQYTAFVLAVSTVLFVRCDAPIKQKMAVFSFIAIPIVHIIISQGAHGYATQYGSILFAVSYIYAVVFNDRNKKLTSTEAELNTAGKIQSSMLPNIFRRSPIGKNLRSMRRWIRQGKSAETSMISLRSMMIICAW